MVHPDDLQAIRNALNSSAELSPELEAEYSTRLRMFHGAGGSGPLGPLAIVWLLRAFNLEPPKQAQPERIDFRNLPRQKTRIRTLRYGSWEPGVFVGLGDNGQIYVRLDSDPDTVREVCNRDDVLRLEHVDYVEVPHGVVIASTSDAALIAAAPDGQVVAITDPMGVIPVAEAATEPPEDNYHEESDEAPVVDWGAQAPGINVWAADESGDPIEGKLHHTDESGGVYVLIGEDTKGPFKGEDVFLA